MLSGGTFFLLLIHLVNSTKLHPILAKTAKNQYIMSQTLSIINWGIIKAHTLLVNILITKKTKEITTGNMHLSKTIFILLHLLIRIMSNVPDETSSTIVTYMISEQR